MSPLNDRVVQDINRFEQKRILRLFVQLSAGLIVGTVLVFPLLALVEYFTYLPAGIKTSLVFGYGIAMIGGLFYTVVRPWWNLKNARDLSHFETLSRSISGELKGVDDKLLNYLQLLGQSIQQQNNRLIELSLGQNRAVIQSINLPSKIQISLSKTSIRWFLPILAAGVLVWVGFFDFVREGSNRLLHPNQTYLPPAPFSLQLNDLPDQVVANQTILFQGTASGPQIPASVFLRFGKRTLKMESKTGGYQQKFENLEPGQYEIALFSGNIESPIQKLTVLHPGLVRNLKIKISPPAYTGKPVRIQENEGNLEVVKGSLIEWELEAEHLLSASLEWDEKRVVPFNLSESQHYRLQQKALESSSYKIKGKNELQQTDQQFNYQLNVTEDAPPSIQAKVYQDSTSLSKQYFVGSISDDYGFTQARVVLEDPKTKKIWAETRIPIRLNVKTQSFIYSPSGKIAKLLEEKESSLVFQVWDNDAVSGPKKASSQIFDMKANTQEAIQKSLDQMDTKNEEKLEELVKETQTLEKKSKKIFENLKGKKELNWQDKKELQNFVEQQKDLFKQIEQIKKENENSLKNKEENQTLSEELKEKQEQINKMLDEILDDKTKEMLKELEKLLEQQDQNKDQIQDAFEKMEDKNEFIQNELDRAMEMLKQLMVEEKLDKAIKDLDKLAEKEEKAGESNEDKGDKKSPEEKQNAEEEQKKLSEEFKQLKDDVKQMQDINKELKDKNDLDTGDEEQQEIEKDQEKSSEEMKEGKMQKAGSKQKKAAQKMKKMAEKMKKSQMEMEGGGADKEDIGDLRSILENLLQLSFEQEDVYKQISKVNQLDPKYLALTQKQLKIKDDSQIIKDSLKALARRAPEIQSFIMKEMFAMDEAIEESVRYVKARRPDVASAKGQMAMTNINNLMVMLKDALQQMQNQQQSQSEGGKACKKPGKGKPKPKPGNMSQMQKSINDQIAQLKNGKKPGQQMSKELAKLAQKQAAMRRALAEMEKSMRKGGKDKSGGLDDVKAQMEKTERELLNKKLSPETMMRQQQILTRLLESEKAMMEREQEQRREAEQAKSIERTTLPPDLKKLLQKEKAQKEQLIQGNPKLTEFYQEAFEQYIESIQDLGL